MVKRIVVGISGASGVAYAQRLIRLLVANNVQTHLVVSPVGQRMLHDELAMEGVDLAVLAGLKSSDEPVTFTDPVVDQTQQPCSLSQEDLEDRIKLHHYRDVGAVIASGSFQHDGMVIVPCSSNSLSAVAHGSSQNLLHRAAAVTLKERRRLVLVHRETPVSLVEIRNMQMATEAGAIICPANPGFYLLPKSIDDLIDFVVGRVLDLLNVEHRLDVRWGEHHAQGQNACRQKDGSGPLS